MDLISIIIPVYNVEKYLKQCLNSVISQTYQNLEIILINDGSSDNSGEICKEFASKDSRIQYILTENSGPAAARNLGRKMAKGVYISFIDSDDFVPENFIEALHKSITQGNTKLAVCSIKQYRKDKTRFIKTFSQDRHICEIAPDNLEAFCGAVWFYLYDNIFLKTLPPFPAGVCYEDICFMWEALIRAQYVTCCHETFYTYRCDNINSITKSSGKHHNDFLAAYQNIQIFLKSNNLWEDYQGNWFKSCFATSFTLLSRVENSEAFLDKLITMIKQDSFDIENMDIEPLIKRYYQKVHDGYTSAQLLRYIKVQKTKKKIFTLWGLLNMKQRKKRNVINY